ncbi:ArnT family glycosyltransferase [Patescibacteria group bacterium]
MRKKLFTWIERNEGLILLILLSIVLRIPSLYEPYWYGDEGIYLVLGQAWKKGLVFYRDIHDNKPPLLYILAGIAGNVFYFRLMLMAWFGVGVGLFYRLIQILFPKNRKAWNLSTLLMIWLTTITEGNIANAEIFIVMPVVAGMLLVYQGLKEKSKQWQKWAGAGLLFSAGFLLKVPALFDLLAAGVWLVVFEKKTVKEFIKGLWDKKPWLLGVGFLGPIGLSMAYYYKMGAGERYFRSVLGQNIGYLASWGTGEHEAGGLAGQSGLVTRAMVLLIGLVVFYVISKRYKLVSGIKLIVVWFMMAMFGALLSERPYPHYLIQPVVPLAILVSYFFYGQRKVVKGVVLGVLVVAMAYYWQIRFWHYPIVPYYKNFIDYSLGKKSLEDYRVYFDGRANQTYKLAEYLKAKTLPEDRVFIWGNEPYVYALADRLPIGRYTVTYHIVDFNGFDETIEAFDKYKPKVVMVMEYEEKKFEELMSRLMTDYVMVEKIDKALVYRRVNGIGYK